jgi:hypothetical protein
VNVDEALAIVEVLLDDDQQLTDVQEIIFRECWQGRNSYEEIAEIHKYDHEYIKSTGSKLWKYLSDAFGEKVKKSNLKSVITRYLRRQNISFNRSLEVNFHGEHKQNSYLNVVEYQVKEFTQNNSFNFNPAENLDDESQQSDQFVPSETMITTQLEKNIHPVYRNGHGNHHQNLLEESQIKIINILHKLGLLFFTDLHLPLPISQHDTEKRIVVCHTGKLGMIIISESLTPTTETENNSRQQAVLVQAGIHLVKTYTCQQCCQESEQIVQEFLAVLQNLDQTTSNP